eukprot:scaffold225_cov15-Tisochrysis_lutea.AAC.3
MAHALRSASSSRRGSRQPPAPTAAGRGAHAAPCAHACQQHGLCGRRAAARGGGGGAAGQQPAPPMC